MKLCTNIIIKKVTDLIVKKYHIYKYTNLKMFSFTEKSIEENINLKNEFLYHPFYPSVGNCQESSDFVKGNVSGEDTMLLRYCLLSY